MNIAWPLALVTLTLLALAAAPLNADAPPARTLIVAHRGENTTAPENTLASFDLAWQRHDAAIELDIHLTWDGQVVVCHDNDTYRTSGNKQRVVLKDATLAEIQQVDVGSIKGPQYADQRCPTLKQVYDAMPPGGKCYTEIKSGIDVVPAFVDLYKSSGKSPDQIIVISFHPDALAASKKALPRLKHYLLANYKQDKQSKQYADHPGVQEWIKTAKEAGADGLDLGVSPALTEARCHQVLAAGLELHVWTVDDPAPAARYAAWGAKSITTNRAAFITEQLRNSSDK